MIITEPLRRIVETPRALICDICKKEYRYYDRIQDNKDIDERKDDTMEIQEFTHINYQGGYNSVFGDENTIELDICQYCLKEKLGEYIRISNKYDDEALINELEKDIKNDQDLLNQIEKEQE